jgi:hypothetical protein
LGQHARLQRRDTSPEEVTARNLARLVNEEQFFSQGMMDVTGIHEASRGMPSNETSGKAIIARQSEGDVATIIYHTNMVDAQQEAGEVINELIPSSTTRRAPFALSVPISVSRWFASTTRKQPIPTARKRTLT